MKFPFLAGMLALSSLSFAQKGVVLTPNETEKKIDVTIDGKPFTSYFYPGPDVLKKAVLYPLLTAQGTEITRGWPIKPRTGERVDHPHHVGMWLNYESVNAHDFWNNSTKVDHAKHTYGTIVHTGITKMKGGKNEGTLTVTADWLDKNGGLMLTETTTYIFKGDATTRTVDRITTLTAKTEVVFKDVKDGMFAIRVARQLEHPSTGPSEFTDAYGVVTKVATMDNTGITGNYRTSEGVEGDNVWSTRGRWCNLRGKIGDETINVVILDHPKNVGYPTYWHARGYGLFAANPLGQAIFSKGKENLNLTLKNGESTTFRYRTVIASKNLSDGDINKIAADFDSVRR
ncbi:MAG: PmoA family protein [Bacteroidetes bacterium]|nr:PmoA family protein [Bacteroidota bacterium]